MQLWAVQTKLAHEGTKYLVDAFEKLGLNWAAFPVKPFDTFVPDFDWDGPIVYYGSCGLVRRVYENPIVRAKARLFFDPARESPSWYGPRLGEAWLNYGALVAPIGFFMGMWKDLPWDGVRFFRPDSGLKPFAGSVMGVEEFRVFMERVLANDAMRSDEKIVVAEVRPIEREYRNWVIGGEIAATVGYRTMGLVKPWYEPEDSEILREIQDYAREQGAKLAELEAFVLDVAVTPDGLRVVEINDVHASGFYLPDHILDVVAELSNYVARTT